MTPPLRAGGAVDRQPGIVKATAPLASSDGDIPIAELVASAAAAGAVFRLSGARVAATGLHNLPAPLPAALRYRRDEVWNHLGGDRLDRPPLELLDQLGVEIAVPHNEDDALAMIAEIEADADQPGNRGLLGFDIETAAMPGEETRPVVALTRAGVPKASQPGLKGGAGLDPRRATVRLAQLYGGGRRCLVLDTRLVPLVVLAPVLSRRTVVIHNAKFELAFLAQAEIAVPKFEDTLQAAGLLLGAYRRGLDNASVCLSRHRSAQGAADQRLGRCGAERRAARLRRTRRGRGAARLAEDACRVDREAARRRLHAATRCHAGCGAHGIARRDVRPGGTSPTDGGVGHQALADARQKLESITGRPPRTKPSDVRALLTRCWTSTP